MKTIVLATDGSPSAQKATALATEFASALGGRLLVVSVWRPPVSEHGYLLAEYSPELIDLYRKGAEAAIESATEAAAAAGVSATAELRRGDPADEICAAADEAGADLIVLGAHGWGAMKRLVFGSVSTSVLHHARCPVLVVRDETAPGRRAEDAAPVEAKRR